jgi:hypothetical protein
MVWKHEEGDAGDTDRESALYEKEPGVRLVKVKPE